MEITKETLDNKFRELSMLSDGELSDKIDNAACGVMDELRVLLEQLTVNDRMYNNYLNYEARFLETMCHLKWLVYEKMNRFNKLQK